MARRDRRGRDDHRTVLRVPRFFARRACQCPSVKTLPSHSLFPALGLFLPSLSSECAFGCLPVLIFSGGDAFPSFSFFLEGDRPIFSLFCPAVEPDHALPLLSVLSVFPRTAAAGPLPRLPIFRIFRISSAPRPDEGPQGHRRRPKDTNNYFQKRVLRRTTWGFPHESQQLTGERPAPIPARLLY